MIIFWPDEGIFNKLMDKLYADDSELYYSSFSCFDSFLYGEGLYEWRIRQKKGISDEAVNKKLNDKQKEFNAIEQLLFQNKSLQWVIEYKGLLDFTLRGKIYEYDLSNIPIDYIKLT